MKYIKTFNEALGISSDIEQQVNGYIKKIESSEDDTFNLLYQCDSGNFYFKLEMKDELENGALGQFAVMNTEQGGESYLISVLKEDSRDPNCHSTIKNTILHEVKHLDHYIKSKMKFIDLMHQSTDKLSDLKKDEYVEVVKLIFYAFDKNEFESQYHSYYVILDDYIKNKITENPKQSSSDITALVYECLTKTENKLFTWWMEKKEFKFDQYFKDKAINKILYELITSGKTKNYDIFGIYDAKLFLKRALNLYTTKEKNEMQVLKKKLEYEINKRRVIFRKKFIRLFSVMINKYAV